MQTIREFLETIGFRGLIIGIGMTFLCLTASSLAYGEGNHQAALLWVLALALLMVMAYLLWVVNEMIGIGDREQAYGKHIGWEIGYARGVMDEMCDLEQADNPFTDPYSTDEEED